MDFLVSRKPRSLSVLTPFLLNPRYSLKKKKLRIVDFSKALNKMPCRVGNGSGIVENNFSKGIVEYAIRRYDFKIIRCSI